MAKVTIVLSRFIKFSSGIEFVDVATSWARPPGRGATPQRFTNSSVYCIKYAQDCSSDLDRVKRALLSADPLPSGYWNVAVLFYAVSATGNILFALPQAEPSVVSDPTGAQWRVSAITGTCALVSIFTMGAFAVMAW